MYLLAHLFKNASLGAAAFWMSVPRPQIYMLIFGDDLVTSTEPLEMGPGVLNHLLHRWTQEKGTLKNQKSAFTISQSTDTLAFCLSILGIVGNKFLVFLSFTPFALCYV